MKSRAAALSLQIGVCVLTLNAAAGLCAKEPDLFADQIAPLLEQQCLRCHEGEKAKGGLSLATRRAALRGGESGDAIVPGKPDDSLILEAVTGAEPTMPKEGSPLSPEQVQALRRWIADGAAWPESVTLKNARRADKDWWAFRPIVRPRSPSVKNAAWPQTAIDAFILHKLESKRLAPAPPADKLTLLRRATFDLIGLPPTPAEAEAFLADDSPKAFAKVIDRLLSSPHYGERWGRHWLDVAHYADTHGFESDGKRPNAWRYRDFVIQSFNQDKPFDQFVREQIAGDVLAPQDPQSITAIGFLGTGPWDSIGQVALAKDLQRRARADELDDIVSTVTASMLGLTINCARCHDHKFDPLPQRDYYRLTAVFAGVKHGDRLLQAGQDKQHEQQIADLRAKLAQLQARQALAQHAPISLADIISGGNGFGSGERDKGLDPRSGKPTTGKQGVLTGLEANKFVRSSLPFIDGVVVPAGGDAPVPISSTGLAIRLPATAGATWDHIQSGPVLSQDKSAIGGVDYTQPGHNMIGLHANKAITFDLAAMRKEYPPYQALRLQGIAAYGGMGAGASADFAIYVDGELKAGVKGLDYARGPIPIDLTIATVDRFLTLVATDGGNGISYDQIFFGDLQLLLAGEETAKQPADESLRQELAGVQQRLDEALSKRTNSESVYAVVTQAAAPTHLLVRGDPESPGEEVAPGALSVISGLPFEFGTGAMPEGERRAALAKWLTDPANPVVRRVAVNRLWHYHFGTGLVATPSDFGFNGDRPSHPELLDWLASELLDQGWSLKKLHRAFMLSSVYQQSSRFDAAAAEIDSGNRLLWRMNRRRLEGEAVRDAVLSVSGKLNPQIGGPAYQDFEYIEKYAPVYKYVVADRPDLWRRSVYRFVVRSVPDQWLEALDCPNPSNAAPARSRTNTALQALALLNNPFVIQQAEYFAARLKADAADAPGQVELAYRLAFGRGPSNEERQAAAQFVDQQGLFSFCHLLFNASEFVYVD